MFVNFWGLRATKKNWAPQDANRLAVSAAIAEVAPHINILFIVLSRTPDILNRKEIAEFGPSHRDGHAPLSPLRQQIESTSLL